MFETKYKKLILHLFYRELICKRHKTKSVELKNIYNINFISFKLIRF